MKLLISERRRFSGGRTLIFFLLFVLLVSCFGNKKDQKTCYANDISFLKKYVNVVELKPNTGNSKIAVVPVWQGRVITSTATGNNGFSYGWINYSLIQSGKLDDHFNAFGGEERLWLGPEGGPFSLYFAPREKQVIENWDVPSALDTEPFEIIEQTASMIKMKKDFQLVNYSGTKFDIGIKRTVEILADDEIQGALGVKVDGGVKNVSYKSTNILQNKGQNSWEPDSGLLSIWMLSMFAPTPKTTVFIPYKEGTESILGPVVSDDYFGEVSPDRIKIEKGIVYFKADGKFRSKIGISSKRARPFLGSYDADNQTLTVLHCEIPENTGRYVNSKWGIQEDPFNGDVINSYNDGIAENGNQLGPFYELESSSIAAELKPGESVVYSQAIFHFEGTEEILSEITERIFGLSIPTIKGAL